MKSPVIIGVGRSERALDSLNERFRACAPKAALAAGSPWAFALAALVVTAWAISGRWFDYSPVWQLVINTGTTIVTFLMVFVLQNSQSRDSREIHVKLDELLRAVAAARNDVIRCSDLSDEQLDRLEQKLRAMAAPEPAAHPGRIIVPGAPEER